MFGRDVPLKGNIDGKAANHLRKKNKDVKGGPRQLVLRARS